MAVTSLQPLSSIRRLPFHLSMHPRGSASAPTFQHPLLLLQLCRRFAQGSQALAGAFHCCSQLALQGRHLSAALGCCLLLGGQRSGGRLLVVPPRMGLPLAPLLCC